MQTFGKRTGKKVASEPFELLYTDGDGETQVFQGQFAARSDGSSFAAMFGMMGRSDPAAFGATVTFLTKQMDNRDGAVRAGWSAQGSALPVPPDLDEDERADWQHSYRGPDGQIYEFRDQATLAKWEDKSTWTTKRRWIALMHPDNQDDSVDIEDLMAMVEHVMTLVTERPTQPRG
jgi:hypothetical protein